MVKLAGERALGVYKSRLLQPTQRPSIQPVSVGVGVAYLVAKLFYLAQTEVARFV